jgi:hypothetical protein
LSIGDQRVLPSMRPKTNAATGKGSRHSPVQLLQQRLAQCFCLSLLVSMTVTYACCKYLFNPRTSTSNLLQHTINTPSMQRASGGLDKSATMHTVHKPSPLSIEDDVGHFTTHDRNEFTCKGEDDRRLNCTRCAPGWHGMNCRDKVLVHTCTLQRCIGWARCPWAKPLRVYVHVAPTDPTALWLNSMISAEYRDILAALRASMRFVNETREACLKVPWFDTLCIGNRCMDTWNNAPKAQVMNWALEALPGWRDGTNHLIFDMSSAYAPILSVGRALYAASSFWAAGQSFRHGYDVPVPLWNQRWQTENSAEDALVRRNADRTLLLTFKGQRMFWCQSIMCAPEDVSHAVRSGQLNSIEMYKHGWVRNKLGALHNGHDIIIATRCARELDDPSHCEADCRLRCSLEQTLYDALDYRMLLKNSTFGLVLPGITPMSYRLAETMSYGAVPVIASDFITLPFTKLLDWQSFSIRISEAQVLSLPQVLRDISPQRVKLLQVNAVAAYERCFASPGKIALCTIDELEQRMFGRLL